MEIVDKLVGPACAQCAVKHMAAALACLADMVPGARMECERHWVLWERAVINATEAVEGYSSHYALAVGLMELAEEAAAELGRTEFSRDARAERLKMMETWSHVPSTLGSLVAKFRAHMDEAERESPGLLRVPDCSECTVSEAADAVSGAIAEARSEFFELEAAHV